MDVKSYGSGFLVGCAFPYAEFGRLSVPTRQLRYQDGCIRFTESKDGQRLLCFLVNKDNQLISAKDQIEACVMSERLGRAVQYYLAEFNQFEAGEHPGVRDQVRVSV